MTDREVLVIGAAVVHRGRVLAARRTAPETARGFWEFPGGKVEPGEDPEAALVREIHEELACGVQVRGHLHGEQLIKDSYVLRVVLAHLVEGEPIPHEHDAVRWLGADQLDDVRWLAPDLPFLPQLRELLGEGGNHVRTVRAVFHERDDASLVASRLLADGFAAEVVRDRFAGEDDDEDHAWAVLTDAPLVVVESFVDELDGWVERPADARPVAGAHPSPLDLPEGPRRVKGHFRDP